MRNFAAILFLAASPCFAQDAAPAVTEQQIIAMSAEDADACKAGGCKLITEEVIKKISEQLHRAALLEEIVARQAEELKKKPVRTYCM